MTLPSDILLNLDKLPDSMAVTEKHAAVIMSVSVSKLQKDRVKGGGVRFMKLGTAKSSSVRYSLGDIRVYQRDHLRDSTSAYYAVSGNDALVEIGLVKPYALFGGRIQGFIESLERDPDNIVWLTREEAAAVPPVVD